MTPRLLTSQDRRRRVVIEAITPEVDGGRFPAKRIVGDRVRVEADVFVDGHDSVSATLLYRPERSESWSRQPMQAITRDRWFGEFTVTEVGVYRYTIQAWVDAFDTWHRDLLKRIQANTDTGVDYLIGANLIDSAAARAYGADAALLRRHAEMLRASVDVSAKRQPATDPSLADTMTRYPDLSFSSEADRELSLVVDTPHARFSSWYEFFPRSTSPVAGEHGTFKTSEERLKYAAEMGFDVIYLPPIHPIGTTFRKGRNNSPAAQPGDVGSPWAIGSPEGGHKAIHPQLGGMEDFRRLVKRAWDLKVQLALDIAFQISPDHPYGKDHEEWFRKRPDGTIQYAENPPKKYQDIYPFDFETTQSTELWQELKSVFVFWIKEGIRIFRVDNPHTKSLAFWEWLITEIKREWPSVLFLAEAFTRPSVTYRLAKVGFSQSYTYFPWRNTKWDLTTYFTELNQSPVKEFFRPNHWPNTPDILTEFLQTGLRSAFMIRYLLAATLAANYGIYGPAFELLDSHPVRPGSEEYLNSEKYQIRHWDLDKSGNLRDLITAVNRIRHQNPALQQDWTLEFHPTDNDLLICYSKHSPDGSNLILVVMNLDPYHTHSGFVHLPLDRLKIDENRPYEVHDLLTGAKYLWNGPRNFVQLNPHELPAHIFRLRHELRSESDFEYFF